MALTEGQWLWLMVHMSIDNDEHLDAMCDKCKSKIDTPRCNTCGEVRNEFITNPTFDEELFNKLKKTAD